MRRRAFLSVGAGAVGATLAGCTVPGAGDRHPFAGRTVTVRIDDESDTVHDVEAIGIGALEYWEAHAPTYVEFSFSYSLVDDDADVILRFVDDPSACEGVEGYSERVLGCAPIIHPGRRLRGPVTATTVTAARPSGKIRITTKHEIGHLLGLGHDDEPQHIMSHRPELRIPMFERRMAIWETVLEAQRRSGQGLRLYNHGVGTWEMGNFSAAEAAFDGAAGDFGTTRTLLLEAIDLTGGFEDDPRVETVDMAGLGSHLDLLVERMELAISLASTSAEAASIAGGGDLEAANDRMRDANDYIRNFNDLPSPSMGDVAIALGLVRGIDREDPILDIEDEVEDPGEVEE